MPDRAEQVTGAGHTGPAGASAGAGRAAVEGFSAALDAAARPVRGGVERGWTQGCERAGLEDAGAALRRELARFASADPQGLGDLLRTAFGAEAQGPVGRALVARLAAGEVPMPALRAVGDETLPPGAQGAYSAEGAGMILVHRDLLGEPGRLRRVLAEELGHHLDRLLGGGDAMGDEGAIFARRLAGERLGAGELAALRAEDDAGRLRDGRSVEFLLSEPAPRGPSAMPRVPSLGAPPSIGAPALPSPPPLPRPPDLGLMLPGLPPAPLPPIRPDAPPPPPPPPSSIRPRPRPLLPHLGVDPTRGRSTRPGGGPAAGSYADPSYDPSGIRAAGQARIDGLGAFDDRMKARQDEALREALARVQGQPFARSPARLPVPAAGGAGGGTDGAAPPDPRAPWRGADGRLPGSGREWLDRAEALVGRWAGQGAAGVRAMERAADAVPEATGPDGRRRAPEAWALARALAEAASRGLGGEAFGEAALDRALGLDPLGAAQGHARHAGAFGRALAGEGLGIRADALDAITEGHVSERTGRRMILGLVAEGALAPGELDGEARTGRAARARARPAPRAGRGDRGGLPHGCHRGERGARGRARRGAAVDPRGPRAVGRGGRARPRGPLRVARHARQEARDRRRGGGRPRRQP